MSAGDAPVGWEVHRLRGGAGDLHAQDLPVPATRQVWVMGLDRPALVLGSSQREDIVDHDALHRRGADLVRRRSGGGAVLLDPADTVWVDLILPRGDDLWDDDVGRAFLWLGETWRRALAGFGIGANLHGGPARPGSWGHLVCFAGLGTGEVSVDRRKVVGLSQRRTREAARFQSVVYVGAAPDTDAARGIGDLLVEPSAPGDRADLERALREGTHAPMVTGKRLLAAFLEALAGTSS